MNAKQQEQIEAHGRKLLAIFPQARERDPVKLCKALRRLEVQAHAIGLRLCNGPEYREGEADECCEAILQEVAALLYPPYGPDYWSGIFINRDPRSYALKISSEVAKNLDIHKDWGGYGILAPEITGKE